MENSLVRISDLTLKFQHTAVLRGLDWQIFRNENWLLGGKSGSGKTSLAHAISGAVEYAGSIQFHFNPVSPARQRVIFVPSWYQFTNLEGDRNFYYQQRYNRQQTQDTLTVKAELMSFAETEDLAIAEVNGLLERFDFHDCLPNQLIELSSGEHKKLQLIKAFWLKPQLLIIDQPYTGLDRQSRESLNNTIDELSEQGSQFILISNDQELPSCINRFAEIQDGKVQLRESLSAISHELPRSKKALPYFLQQAPRRSADTFIKMNNLSVKYGEKQILSNISWTVKPGEKWLLQGPNGSGKSTLLSLINGDHPQAYSSDLYLFGKKRGSGESIWEIKEHLGIISPELHWYFDSNAKVWQSIASGFYDSVGLFRDLTYEKQKEVDEVLDFFDLTEHKNQLLHSLPLGKQRLALLARTIIKNPELLILDEPCQGLDSAQTQHFNEVVDELVQYGKTLIYVGHFESHLPSCIDNRIQLENGRINVIENLTESIER